MGKRNKHFTNYSSAYEKAETKALNDVPVESGQVEEPESSEEKLEDIPLVEPKEEVQEAEADEKPAFVEKAAKVTNCELVNVRKTANANGEVLFAIPAGEEIRVLGEEGEFYNVKTANGIVAFIKKDFLLFI